MSKIADKITNYIMIKGMIDKDDYDIYHYGFQTGIEFILCLAISVIMASSLGLIREFAIIILVLLPLRAYICGIHMKKFVSCLFCSVALVTCGPYLVQKIMISNHIVLCLSVIAIVILHKCSYITTEYQCDSDEVTYFASIRKRILLFVFMAECIFLFIDKSEFLKLILYALLVAVFSVVLQIILIKKKQDFT